MPLPGLGVHAGNWAFEPENEERSQSSLGQVPQRKKNGDHSLTSLPGGVVLSFAMLQEARPRWLAPRLARHAPLAFVGNENTRQLTGIAHTPSPSTMVLAATAVRLAKIPRNEVWRRPGDTPEVHHGFVDLFVHIESGGARHQASRWAEARGISRASHLSSPRRASHASTPSLINLQRTEGVVSETGSSFITKNQRGKRFFGGRAQTRRRQD